MDNLGAIVGPLLALGLIAITDVRTAILLSIIPGLMAVLAILYAIHATPRPKPAARKPLRIVVRPVLQGPLRKLFTGIGLFETGAATLLILRATDLLRPEHGTDNAAKIAVALYVLSNIAAPSSASAAAARLTAADPPKSSSPGSSPSPPPCAASPRRSSAPASFSCCPRAQARH